MSGPKVGHMLQRKMFVRQEERKQNWKQAQKSRNWDLRCRTNLFIKPYLASVGWDWKQALSRTSGTTAEERNTISSLCVIMFVFCNVKYDQGMKLNYHLRDSQHVMLQNPVCSETLSPCGCRIIISNKITDLKTKFDHKFVNITTNKRRRSDRGCFLPFSSGSGQQKLNETSVIEPFYLYWVTAGAVYIDLDRVIIQHVLFSFFFFPLIDKTVRDSKTTRQTKWGSVFCVTASVTVLWRCNDELINWFVIRGKTIRLLISVSVRSGSSFLNVKNCCIFFFFFFQLWLQTGLVLFLAREFWGIVLGNFHSII